MRNLLVCLAHARVVLAFFRWFSWLRNRCLLCLWHLLQSRKFVSTQWDKSNSPQKYLLCNRVSVYHLKVARRSSVYCFQQWECLSSFVPSLKFWGLWCTCFYHERTNNARHSKHGQIIFFLSGKFVLFSMHILVYRLWTKLTQNLLTVLATFLWHTV